MVEHSDRVIVVYDGREKGGTVKTIRFSHQSREELRDIPIGLNLDKTGDEKKWRYRLACGIINIQP